MSTTPSPAPSTGHTGPVPVDGTREPTAADLAGSAAELATGQLPTADGTPVPGQVRTPATPGPDRAVVTAVPGRRATVALGDVLPVPASVRPEPGADFPLTVDTVIHAEPAARAEADRLAALLRPATGLPLPVTVDPTAPAAGAITLTLADPGLGPEGYRLDVTPTGVRLTAATPAGLGHGVQTLRQLLPAAVESPTPVAGPWVLPGGTIADRPRFGYRGAMLDVARHFFGVDEVLRVVDHLARYKLNHLHLHLTDDQGWRIAVESWPRLTEVGGATQVGGGPGGWYTRDDYRRIVRYAAERHVTVVPEIDLPGHTNAALTAYGRLAPDGVTPPPYTGTEVGFSYLDPDRELTYAFVADVLGEVAALTPGPYLHIGGDEAFKVPADAYARFVDRVQPIVADTGKTVLGWHQIAPAAHSPGRVLQYWGTTASDPVVVDAVRRGARLLMSPADRTYLDMRYTPESPVGHDWAGAIDVRRAYDWDPAGYLDDVPAEAVLGLAAPLWTEYVTSRAEIEYMLLPRLPALAELGWSPRDAHDWAAFRGRLAAQGPRWEAAGTGYHRSPEVPWPVAAVPAPRVPES
ncbi:beta-N-acetylhexosaminidase [Micromonospora sp. NPDC050187]|uniref:beta-N-acetylhexosaminidase n=1 Tax=Micromonospora sp. NPDC050187 TaxID=3364277 RepID=UPI00378912C6